MTVEWRTWLYGKLSDSEFFTAVLPADQIHGGGSLTTPPAVKPFMVIRIEPTLPGPFKGVSQCRTTLWVHDEPGDYMQIDTILGAARSVLAPDGFVGQVTDVGGVAVVWQGDSGDLANQDYKTILRTSTYDLLGRG